MPSGTSVAILGTGALMGYAAVTGKSPLQAVFYAIRGSDPRQAAQTQGIAASATLASGSGGGSSAVVAAAASQLGKPYAWAQPSNLDDPNPKSFDCSGLAAWSWRRGGYKVKNHNTVAQINELKKYLVPISQVQPGAMVFYGSRQAPHHVAIYAGNGEIIEAPDFNIPVRRHSMTAASDLVNVCANFPATAGNSDTIQPGEAFGGTAVSNQALGKMLAQPYGWSSGAQWTALDELWTRESGWSNTATGSMTAQGQAYGIAQALPASKYPAAGRPPTSDAATQIRWGLAYIKGRYGSPVAAWQHELANNWY